MRRHRSQRAHGVLFATGRARATEGDEWCDATQVGNRDLVPCERLCQCAEQRRRRLPRLRCPVTSDANEGHDESAAVVRLALVLRVELGKGDVLKGEGLAEALAELGRADLPTGEEGGHEHETAS